MTGPIKCSYGCGRSFYSGEEQRQHEQACRQGSARQEQRSDRSSQAFADGQRAPGGR